VKATTLRKQHLQERNASLLREIERLEADVAALRERLQWETAIKHEAINALLEFNGLSRRNFVNG
jgi:hypothetical protein